MSKYKQHFFFVRKYTHAQSNPHSGLRRRVVTRLDVGLVGHAPHKDAPACTREAGLGGMIEPQVVGHDLRASVVPLAVRTHKRLGIFRSVLELWSRPAFEIHFGFDGEVAFRIGRGRSSSRGLFLVLVLAIRGGEGRNVLGAVGSLRGGGGGAFKRLRRRHLHRGLTFFLFLFTATLNFL